MIILHRLKVLCFPLQSTRPGKIRKVNKSKSSNRENAHALPPAGAAGSFLFTTASKLSHGSSSCQLALQTGAQEESYLSGPLIRNYFSPLGINQFQTPAPARMVKSHRKSGVQWKNVVSRICVPCQEFHCLDSHSRL